MANIRDKNPHLIYQSEGARIKMPIELDTKIRTQAIVCGKCAIPTIAEYDTLTNNVTIYDFESYVNKVKVKHRHTCDIRTKAMVVARVATEKRLLEDIDPNDYPYTVKRKGSRETNW
jgi:hypothetical protein